MKAFRLNFVACLLAILFSAMTARADDSVVGGVTAVIDIDSRSVSIPVNNLPSCANAIASRINNLKALYNDSLTASSVVGECFGADGQLLASGRCGAKMIGQTARLCVPAIH